MRLPGDVPPEFRKKLWVSLAERYLHIKRLDFDKEAVRCLSEQWKSDDQELADQIIKDLHRTGSSFCTGPSGTVNQAKLKRVLVGYARWNKEVGYCQVSVKIAITFVFRRLRLSFNLIFNAIVCFLGFQHVGRFNSTSGGHRRSGGD